MLILQTIPVPASRLASQEYRCIYVDDPEHLYVSGDYFVSHNTSIIYAMIYALYGETPDGAKSDEVIKNDVGKNCFAKVVFTHFGHEYEITRYRKDKEFKNKVIMYRDGKDVTLSTNKETLRGTPKYTGSDHQRKN